MFTSLPQPLTQLTAQPRAGADDPAAAATPTSALPRTTDFLCDIESRLLVEGPGFAILRPMDGVATLDQVRGEGKDWVRDLAPLRS